MRKIVRTVVITGANRGIGLELVLNYINHGWNVYAVCRQASATLHASGAYVVANVDISQPDAVENLRHRLEHVDIDILIHNASILHNEQFGNLDYGLAEQQFKVNALGPLRVTEALIDNMVEGGKIVLISSRMGSIADNTSGGQYGYRMSKVALNMAGVSLAHDLRMREIAVGIFHPGYIQTDMEQGGGDSGAKEAAEQLIRCIGALNLANSGSFWQADGDELPW